MLAADAPGFRTVVVRPRAIALSPDGDLIVGNRAKEPRAGMIVVALVHGDRTLKRLRYVDGRHWLVPEAEGFRDILVDEHVQIWGVVVGVARKMV